MVDLLLLLIELVIVNAQQLTCPLSEVNQHVRRAGFRLVILLDLISRLRFLTKSGVT